jgi:hypothetical protein
MIVTATTVRDEARLKAQRHLDALFGIVEDLEVDNEHKDAMRHRLRELWKSASLAMSLASEMDKEGEVP